MFWSEAPGGREQVTFHIANSKSQHISNLYLARTAWLSNQPSTIHMGTEEETMSGHMTVISHQDKSL